MPIRSIPLLWEGLPQEAVPVADAGDKPGVVALVNPAVGLVDLVGRVDLLSKSGSPTTGSGPIGRVANVLGSNDAFYGTVSPAQIAGTAASILIVFTAESSPTDYAAIAGVTYTNSNANPYKYIEITRGGPGAGVNSNVMLSWNAGGAASNLLSTATIVAGRTYAALGTAESGAQAFYLAEWVGGGFVVIDRVTSSASGALSALSAARLQIGDSLNGRTPAARVSLFALWNGAVAPAYARDRVCQPGRVFDDLRIKFPVAAAGGGLPTLSNARVTSVTTTTAVPLVDYAY